MIVLIIAIILCIIVCGVFLFAYSKSKGQYEDYIEGLDKKEYALIDLIPLGIFINEMNILQKVVPAKLYKYIHKYNNGIYAKVLEISGIKYSDYYFMIHNANKTTFSLVVSAGVSLFSVITALQADYSTATFFIFITVISLFAMPFLVDNSINDKIEKRRLNLQMEFPEFINKLTLLVNAGMTISKAWEKIVMDNKKKSVLYIEMQFALAEIQSGKPEAVAYEEFARRCKVKEIIKFVSVIILNLKKGGADVVPVLKIQAMECWEMRKSVAKRLGEEASTKILIPLMIMFVGIIIIVATPAILSFSM